MSEISARRRTLQRWILESRALAVQKNCLSKSVFVLQKSRDSKPSPWGRSRLTMCEGRFRDMEVEPGDLTFASRTPTDFSGCADTFRTDWHFDASTAMQHLVNELAHASGESFEDSFLRFASAVPPPRGHVEALCLRKELVAICLRAGHQLHEDQHRGRSDTWCAMPAITSLEGLWYTGPNPPLFLLRLWLSRFLKSLDATHPDCLPVRAARALQRSSNRSLPEEELARKLGCSRSVLLRRFYSRYGLTPKAYHTRVRLRKAVRRLQGSNVKTDSIAYGVGYHGSANFYSSLYTFTGLTPAVVRVLTDSEVERLFRTALEINPARLVRFVATESAPVSSQWSSAAGPPPRRRPDIRLRA
jgi:AraC-like DNA-binding protein